MSWINERRFTPDQLLDLAMALGWTDLEWSSGYKTATTFSPAGWRGICEGTSKNAFFVENELADAFVKSDQTDLFIIIDWRANIGELPTENQWDGPEFK